MELMGGLKSSKNKHPHFKIHYHPLLLMGVNRIKMDFIGVPNPSKSR